MGWVDGCARPFKERKCKSDGKSPSGVRTRPAEMVPSALELKSSESGSGKERDREKERKNKQQPTKGRET